MHATDSALTRCSQCSYNAVNGVPSCASDWLLGTLLRDSWQFDGYVTSGAFNRGNARAWGLTSGVHSVVAVRRFGMSYHALPPTYPDCDADSDVFFSHHYTNTPGDAVHDILHAGTDVDCGGFMTKYAPGALTNGTITEEDMNVVLRRLFRVRIRLGHFDSVHGPLSAIGPQDVCTPYALELARDGVRQSAVLAKNAGGVLPLKAAKYANANVVVIGPNVDLGDTTTCKLGSCIAPLLFHLTCPAPLCRKITAERLVTCLTGRPLRRSPTGCLVQRLSRACPTWAARTHAVLLLRRLLRQRRTS